MKIAVVIDEEKISQIKEKIQRDDYIEHAIEQLAHEISTAFM